MNYYIDIVAQKNVGVPPYVSLGFLVRAVHSYLTSTNETSVVLTFPRAVYGEGANPGDRVRIFEESEEGLKNVLEYIGKDKRFNDILIVQDIKKVPESINKYESLWRVRLPSRNKKEHYAGQKELLVKRRLEIASNMQKLPFIPMQSSSTQNTYNLHFGREVKEMSYNDAQTLNSCKKLDGYGFSHETARFWIPHWS